MAIDRAEVERVAALARLELPPEALDRTARELSSVLEFIGALQRLDLSGCEPTSFAPADAPLREDQPDGRRLTSEQALAAAPETDEIFFLVPPIVENVNP
jgi:aspartyl-tRNA(Asn)/glutamyl-tRNA(Gln) amidotransferase subunit C